MKWGALYCMNEETSGWPFRDVSFRCEIKWVMYFLPYLNGKIRMGGVWKCVCALLCVSCPVQGWIGIKGRRRMLEIESIFYTAALELDLYKLRQVYDGLCVNCIWNHVNSVMWLNVLFTFTTIPNDNCVYRVNVRKADT